MTQSVFNVCTYNLLGDPGETFQVYKDLTDLDNSTDVSTFKSNLIAAEDERTDKIVNKKATVYCLHSVGSVKRSVIQKLIAAKYKIYNFAKPDGKYDNAIVLDPIRFKKIANHSMNVKLSDKNEKDVAIVSAVDRETNQNVVFVSASFPGDEGDIVLGDEYCKEVLKKISQIGKGVFQIVGVDLNGSPNALKLFKNQNLKACRDPIVLEKQGSENLLTNRNQPIISTIFTKIKSIFFSTIEKNGARYCVTDFKDWNQSINFLPIFAEIGTKMKSSKIADLCNSIMSLFKKLLCFKTSKKGSD